jgi:hypothetical protein
MSQAAFANMFTPSIEWAISLEPKERKFGRRSPSPSPFVSAEARAESIGVPDASNVVCELAEEEALMGKIDELAAQTAARDWDGEQGEAVDKRQWDDVRRIASKAAQELLGVPAPFISACGDGSAHLQWTTARGNRGVIEIGSRSYSWSFVPMSDDDGEDEVIELRSPDEALAKVKALFGRA